jgi:hypothetical protein
MAKPDAIGRYQADRSLRRQPERTGLVDVRRHNDIVGQTVFRRESLDPLILPAQQPSAQTANPQ